MSSNMDESGEIVIAKLKSTLNENPAMFDTVVRQAEELAAASPNNG